ncbi:MAG: kinase [Streptosporangiaceae bacterium]
MNPGMNRTGPVSPAGCNSPRAGAFQAPRLITLRGNSASGKSTVAAEIRARYGRGLAIVSQDNLRRVILRERDIPGGANIGLIDLTARYALDHGYHVIIEGIMYADRYGPMLTQLRADHAGQTDSYYFDIEFSETVERHATKAQAAEYGEAEMASWYRPCDLLPGMAEEIITASMSLDQIVTRVMNDCGLPAQSIAGKAGLDNVSR